MEMALENIEVIMDLKKKTQQMLVVFLKLLVRECLHRHQVTGNSDCC